jgi:Family of unknown function (DUF5931)
MTVWTVGTTIAYARPDRRTRTLLSVDLAVTAALLLSTAALQYPSALRHGVAPVTATWLAGPVLAWAVRYGRRAGLITAVIMSGCDLALVRGVALSVALNGIVLLLAGVIVGHLARLAAEVEAERQHATEVEAASRERERLARRGRRTCGRCCCPPRPIGSPCRFRPRPFWWIGRRRTNWRQRCGRRWTTSGGTAASRRAPGCSSKTSPAWSR